MAKTLIMAIGGVLSAPYMVRWQYSTVEQEFLYSTASLASEREAKMAAQMAVGASCGALCSQLAIDAVGLLSDLAALFLADLASANVFSALVVSSSGGGGGEGGEVWVVWQQWARAFPGAVYCNIGPQMVFAGANTEGFGCGLPLNNYYKYACLSLLSLAGMLLCCSLLSMLYHGVLASPFVSGRRWVRSLPGLSRNDRDAMLATFSKDTLYTLHCINNTMSTAATHALLRAMSRTASGKLTGVAISLQQRVTEPANMATARWPWRTPAPRESDLFG